MNKLNDIFKKVADLEKNAEEIKLAKVQVELATIYDDLKGTLQNANMPFFKALELRGQCSKLCRESITKNEAILKELNKVEPLLKQIGLDSEIKKVENAKQEVSRNIALIDRALTEFLAI